MSIILNNGVQNVKNTPGIIQDSSINLPLATSVANGTVFIDNDSLNILINKNGIWTLLYASGSTPTLQQVLTAGNTATDKTIIIDNTIQGLLTTIGDGFNGMTVDDNNAQVYGQYRNNIISLQDAGNNKSVELTFDFLTFTVPGFSNQYLYPNPASIAKVYLPENDGTLALQDPPLQSSITTTPFTPSGTKNRIYRVQAGASSIVLNPANWVDRKTLTFCFDVTAVTFSVTGGATLRGIALVNITGLYYVTYLSSANTFYLSHTA